MQQKTIQPTIEAVVAKGARIHIDEYDIYARLPAWGYQHKTVCHAHGEYARDEDGDGFCEIHVNTMEGTWSLLRSWLRPHPCAALWQTSARGWGCYAAGIGFTSRPIAQTKPANSRATAVTATVSSLPRPASAR